MKKSFNKAFAVAVAVIAISFLSFVAVPLAAQGSTASGAGATLPTTQIPKPPTPEVNWFACATSPASCGIYLTTVAVQSFLSVMGVYFAFQTKIALGINDHIFDSPLVQTGFSVSLAIANLGFVLGIIIIAIATILRRENYGMKQLLWKLVIMAILVNFGLVITRPIVGFSDSMTQYFVNAVSGGGGYDGFVTNLQNVLKPVAVNLPPPTTGSTITSVGCNASLLYIPGSMALCSWVTNTFTSDNGSDTFWSTLLAALFSIVLNIFIVIAEGAMAILLLVRYVILGILLVLLPLAWLTWIFPKFESEFDKWWSQFLRWTLFPPAMFFFVYLAFITVANTSPNTPNAYIQSAILLTKSGPEAALALIFPKGLGVGLIQQAADEIILIGLMIGGFFAASSLSGQVGKKVIGAAQTATKWVGGQVWKGGKKGGQLALDRVRVAGKKYDANTKETTTWLQRQASKLQGIPLLRGPAAAAARLGSPEAIKKEKEEKIQKYIDAQLRGLTKEGVISRATSKTAFFDEDHAAGLAQEIARRDLTTDPAIAPLMNRYIAAADHAGNLEKVTSNRPDLMPQRETIDRVTGATRMETEEEAIARAVRASKSDIVKANAKIFNRTGGAFGMTPARVESATLALSPAQLGLIGSDDSPENAERQTNITDTIQELVRRHHLAQQNPTTLKYEINKTALATAAAGNPELKNIDRLIKRMETDQNWISALGN